MKRNALMIAAVGLFLFAQAAQADWTPVKRLTFTSGTSWYPTIAVDFSGHIHLFWEDDTPGNLEIYYKTSADGGGTWSTSRRLTWTSGASEKPAVAVDSFNNIHVVWHDDTPGNDEIYYKKSTDGGTTWSAGIRLTWTPGNSQDASIAVDASGDIYVVWDDDTPGNDEIYYKKSTDGGFTWPTSSRLTFASGDSSLPVISVDSSGKVHLIWQDQAPGNLEIYYRRSPDGGTTWDGIQRLTWTSKDSNVPDMAVYSGIIYIVWYDYTYGFSELHFKKSLDGGNTWTPSKRLTWTANFCYDPALVVDFLGWPRIIYEYYTPGYDDLYYQESLDGGATWSTGQRITWTPGDSWYPDVAADSSSNLHVVWQNLVLPGNFEIYYRKFIETR
jgi:BNR repeat-like domain